MKKSVLFILIMLVGIIGCRKEDVSSPQSILLDDPNNTGISDQIIITNSSFFGIFSYNDHPFTIRNVNIQNDNIIISITYSGGCGAIGKSLIAGSEIMESNPPQRHLKLFFTDWDQCEAAINVEWTYNITPLRVDGFNSVILHFEGWNIPLLYEY